MIDKLNMENKIIIKYGDHLTTIYGEIYVTSVYCSFDGPDNNEIDLNNSNPYLKRVERKGILIWKDNRSKDDILRIRDTINNKMWDDMIKNSRFVIIDLKNGKIENNSKEQQWN